MRKSKECQTFFHTAVVCFSIFSLIAYCQTYTKNWKRGKDVTQN